MTITYQVVPDRSAWNESGDGIVVLDLQDSHYLSFNGTAATLWRRMTDGPVSTADLEQALLAEYTVPAERAGSDVAAFVAQLIGRGLVTQHAAP